MYDSWRALLKYSTKSCPMLKNVWYSRQVMRIRHFLGTETAWVLKIFFRRDYFTAKFHNRTSYTYSIITYYIQNLK